MGKYYRFCEHNFYIKAAFDYFYNFAKDYEIDVPDEYLEITDTVEEVQKWQKDHNDEFFPLDYLETLLIHSKISDLIAKDNCFIFHGSTIAVGSLSNGFIFTAPSGTGKSTHISLLKKLFNDSINVINDDKPFISLDNRGFHVYGSPWNGKARLSNNVRGDLKGIFIISRSPVNKIKKISSDSAMMQLIRQIHLPKGVENTKNGTDLLVKLIKEIPIYSLEVNMEDDAAVLSMNTMKDIIKE